jgi:pimeloyl-ACP methyl ester carboxylesterase
MLAFDRYGSGDPLLLLHGTTSSRAVWDPLRERLATMADVIAIDLPGHGESPGTSYTPPEWAWEVGALMDDLGLEQATIVGHSAGGWTSLELAKLGRASAVLALAPAGLWQKSSPRLTDMRLNANWRLGRVIGPRSTVVLRFAPVRAVSLRTISGRPRAIPPEVAVASAKAAIATDSFPRHFRETRVLRFEDGAGIEVPVTVIWGDRDRIALERKSRFTDVLPRQTQVETWHGAGHMLMWDAPELVVAEIDETLRAARRSPESGGDHGWTVVSPDA